MKLHTLTRCRASNVDMELLFQIYSRSMRVEILAAFGTCDVEEQRKMFFQSTDPSVHELFFDDNSAIGFWWVERSVNQLQLRRISLLPEYQGQGIGTSLVRELVDEAKFRSIPVRLRVLKTSRARKLYRLIGFQEERRSRYHIHMVYFA